MANESEFDAALAKWRAFFGEMAGTVSERKPMGAERLAWLQALAEAAHSPLPPEEVLWLVDCARQAEHVAWLCATARNAAELLEDEDPDEVAEVVERVAEIEALAAKGGA